MALRFLKDLADQTGEVVIQKDFFVKYKYDEMSMKVTLPAETLGCRGDTVIAKLLVVLVEWMMLVKVVVQ